MRVTHPLVVLLALSACESRGTPDAGATIDGGDVVDAGGCIDARAPVVTPPTCEVPAAQTGPLRFERCVLDGTYRGEGIGAFDVDGDGERDLVTDQVWYRSPGLEPHPIRELETWSPFGAYAVGFGAYPMDVDADGCTDVVVPPLPGTPLYWYEHPCACGGGADGTWARHVVQPEGTVGLETPFLVDLHGDGAPVLVSSDYARGLFGLFSPTVDPRAPWTLRPLAPAGFPGGMLFQHGAGVGDLDADGDLDVITSWGWFESPGDRDGDWIAHTDDPFGVANRCSDMPTLDVNADGLPDVLCASPHDTGLSWLEQIAPAPPSTEPTFVEHAVPEAASIGEMHALRLADLDGDGDDEIVTGTRWCAHCGPADTDDPAGARVVYFDVDRSGVEPRFDLFVLDDGSGIGVMFDVADVEADGDLDVVTANKHGTFFFRRL